jgi:tetratricopeptide (TPR) repeat protein
MRGPLVGVAILFGFLASAASARAGVYVLSEEPYFHRLVTFRDAKFILSDLRGCDERGKTPAQLNPVPRSKHAEYRALVDRLAPRERDGSLSTPERIDLGGCYVRLGRFNDAVRVLEAGDRTNFLILLNLAAAYQGLNELQRAIDYQERALAAWPAVWAGWTTVDWNWYRRVERYYLTLLQLRRGGNNRGDTLENVFPRVRFVGPSGKYEAGNLALRSQDELPPDANLIALQLVLWLPQDDGVYWLFGEILNARGEVDAASSILNELVDKGFRSAELRAHRQVLLGPALIQRRLRETLPFSRQALLVEAAPRGFLLAPGGAAACNELAWQAAAWFENRQADFQAPGGQANVPAVANEEPKAASPAPGNVLPDFFQVTVGFGAGVIAGALGLLQFEQWRRRKAAAGQKQQVS